MVGYIVSFAAGAGTGIALVLAHRRGVERAVQAERDKSGREIDRISREKSQMQQRYENQLRDRESRISYQRGMEVGKREGGRSAATTSRCKPQVCGGVAATRPEGVAGPTGLNASNGERLEHALKGETGKRSVQIGSRGSDIEGRAAQ